jgi:hypothetical protein
MTQRLWISAFIAVAVGFGSPSRADRPESVFQGGWAAWLCPRGVAHDPDKCSNFAVYLYAKDGKLCGAHTFASAGASRVDEGVAPSIVGTIVNSSADIEITSGRADPTITLHAQISHSQGRLHWRTLESKSGDYLIPTDAWLTRSKTPVFSDEFAASLRSACAR